MFSRIERTRRSNHSIFLPQNFVSPFNDTAEHITGFGLARIDFERCAVAGKVIYSVEGDSIPNPREIEPPSKGRVIADPQVGGLHHRYRRAA